MKWHVFVTVLGEELFQNSQSLFFLKNFCLWGCKVHVAALLLIWNILWNMFPFYADKNAGYVEDAHN